MSRPAGRVPALACAVSALCELFIAQNLFLGRRAHLYVRSFNSRSPKSRRRSCRFWIAAEHRAAEARCTLGLQRCGQLRCVGDGLRACTTVCNVILQVLKKTGFASSLYSATELDRKWEGYDKDKSVRPPVARSCVCRMPKACC